MQPVAPKLITCAPFKQYPSSYKFKPQYLFLLLFAQCYVKPGLKFEFFAKKDWFEHLM